MSVLASTRGTVEAGRDGAAALSEDDPRSIARYTRWERSTPPAAGGAGPAAAPTEASADDSRIGISSVELGGLHCAACAAVIESALTGVDGVLAADVGFASERASVRWDPARTRPSQWMQAVRRAGYRIAPDGGRDAAQWRRTESRQIIWRMFVAGFCSMQVMMLATPSYVASAADPLAPDIGQLLNAFQWLLSLPVLIFSAGPFISGAWRALRLGRISMDVPVALGIVGTFVASTVATFDPEGIFGHTVYFDSMTMFVAFLWFGRWLEMRSRHQALQGVEQLAGAQEAMATQVGPDGQVREVAADLLAAGDRVRVAAGALVPADGTVLAPHRAQVSESMVTGESWPVVRGPGEAVLAGSVNGTQAFEFTVTHAGADTRQRAIVDLMRQALTERPAASALADRIAPAFLIGVLLLAAGSFLVWRQIDPERAWWIAVAVLVVTCPCALSLATPMTLVAAAGGLARRGVLMRHLAALETLSHVDSVALDKTGTLSQDALTVVGVDVHGLAVDGSASDAQVQEALTRAAALAAWSTHPLARCIVRTAAERGIAAEGPLQEVREEPGVGVRGTDAHGVVWFLGRPGAAVARVQDDGRARVGAAVDAAGAAGAVPRAGAGVGGTSTSDADPGVSGAALAESSGPTTSLLRGGQPVARLRFAEAAREDLLPGIQALRALGLRLTLLSGDRAARVEHFVRSRGLAGDFAAVVGDLDPAGKRAALLAMQQQGRRVAMVGDGLNDAPVLAAADASIAMGSGAVAAREGADAVILFSRVGGVADVVATSRRAVAIIRQNLLWAAIYNLACIPLAMIGWMPPWAAGLGMALSSLLVMLNAQRASSLAPGAVA